CRCRNTCATRSFAAIAATPTARPSCALPKPLPAIGARRRPQCSPRSKIEDVTHGFHAEQRAARMADDAPQIPARENPPISPKRDAVCEPRETFDWGIIKKGSKLGFRTMAVAKEWGGH